MTLSLSFACTVLRRCLVSLRPQPADIVPEETARVARAAFPQGNRYMRLRDELGAFYTDEQFAPLFPQRGQPAESPGRLALVLVMQFAEGLSDRQAADAVRGRLDWKYALALELTDPGFDHSVLSEFRARLLEGGVEQHLLDALLNLFREKGWLKAREAQRTDSTHVLAASHVLNRLEAIGETLRATLNSLAVVAPDWLREQIQPEWEKRYGMRFEDQRWPQGAAARQALADTIGADGLRLLLALEAPTAPPWLRQLHEVQTLRRVWLQQFYASETPEGVRWRTTDDLPPASRCINSPYDPEARLAQKRSTIWTGYKVHLTETCEEGLPHLITNVETTPAPQSDAEQTAPIQNHLAAKDLLPDSHFLDAGYMSAESLLTSQADHQVELVGPVASDHSWQAKAAQGYDLAHFAINWEAQTVTCPRGETARQWALARDVRGHEVISVKFPYDVCRACVTRALCTRAKTEPRELTFRLQAEHETLQAARQRQETAEWKERYQTRAGVEGTISQGIRAFEMRRTRYVGLAKTGLQHVLTAAAINLARLEAWLAEVPLAKTRTSRFAALCAAGA
jgi:transposase